MSLRTRKRLRTMRAVQEAALDLFELHGFEPVAVEEVSRTSGVSPSTIYRHFKTKERLVLWDEADVAIEAALKKHLGTCAPLEALRSSFLEAYSGLEPEEFRHLRRRGALIDQTPQLYAAVASDLVTARIEIQEALGLVYRSKCRDLDAEMTARVAMESLMAGFELWQRSSPRTSLAKCIERAFDAATRLKQSW